MIRGRDLLDNTARQIHLIRLLGGDEPVYGHIPLLVNRSGQKLSKQTHAEALDDLSATANPDPGAARARSVTTSGRPGVHAGTDPDLGSRRFLPGCPRQRPVKLPSLTPLFVNIRFHMNRILVLDSGSRTSGHIDALLAGAEGYESVPVPTLEDLTRLAATATAIVCSFERESEALRGGPLPVLIVDDEPGIRRAVAAIKAGACDYLAGTCTREELLASLDRIITESEDAVDAAFSPVGASPAMQTLTDSIAKVGPTDSTVLITGESGTGKELVARAVHAASERRTAPLISLNCATVPGELIEAELFGNASGRWPPLDRDRRHAVSGRSRRAATGRSGEAPARAGVVRERAPDRRHHPQSRESRHERALPQRPLLPPQGDRSGDPASA